MCFGRKPKGVSLLSNGTGRGNAGGGRRESKDTSYLREKSDYDDFFIAGKEEAERQLNNAVIFVNAVKKYIQEISNDYEKEFS